MNINRSLIVCAVLVLAPCSFAVAGPPQELMETVGDQDGIKQPESANTFSRNLDRYNQLSENNAPIEEWGKLSWCSSLLMRNKNAFQKCKEALVGNVVNNLPENVDETACIGIEYWKGVPTEYTNQACLIHLYSRQLTATKQKKVSAYSVDKKPKTKFCQIVKKLTYNILTHNEVISIDNWVVEPAECVDETNGNISDFVSPSSDFSIGLGLNGSTKEKSCYIHNVPGVGLCADSECQNVYPAKRTYPTCEEK